MVDQPICSVVCPCPFEAALSDETAIPQSQLLKWGRYINAQSGCPKYKRQNYPSSTAVKSANAVPLYYAPQNTKNPTYTSYADCYTKVLSQ